jgi:hypothetical protein
VWRSRSVHTPEKDLEELKDELDALVNRGDPR